MSCKIWGGILVGIQRKGDVSSDSASLKKDSTKVGGEFLGMKGEKMNLNPPKGLTKGHVP